MPESVSLSLNTLLKGPTIKPFAFSTSFRQVCPFDAVAFVGTKLRRTAALIRFGRCHSEPSTKRCQSSELRRIQPLSSMPIQLSMYGPQWRSNGIQFISCACKQRGLGNFNLSYHGLIHAQSSGTNFRSRSRTERSMTATASMTAHSASYHIGPHLCASFSVRHLPLCTNICKHNHSVVFWRRPMLNR